MDLTPQKTTYVLDDNSWLDSQHGTEAGEPVTLDLTTFDATQHANGFIPSGTVVALITAATTGGATVVGPYDDTAVDGRATVYGVLYGGVKVNSGSTKAGGTVLRHCFVKENKLPFQSGQTGRGYIDANGKTDVKGAIFFRTA
jgi:hypothetical protein